MIVDLLPAKNQNRLIGRVTMAPNFHRSDAVLHARAIRALNNLRENSGEGVLDRACASDEPLIVGWVDGSQRKVQIRKTDLYSFELDDGTHNKTEVLYAFETKTAKKFKKDSQKNKVIAAIGLVPAYRFCERLRISKMVFQRLIDESLKSRFTLTDGTVIPCRVRSFGQWEVDADIRGGPITIFRHGIYRIEVGDELLVDFASSEPPS
jgi:hypothetical protein